MKEDEDELLDEDRVDEEGEEEGEGCLNETAGENEEEDDRAVWLDAEATVKASLEEEDAPDLTADEAVADEEGEPLLDERAAEDARRSADNENAGRPVWAGDKGEDEEEA